MDTITKYAFGGLRMASLIVVLIIAIITVIVLLLASIMSIKHGVHKSKLYTHGIFFIYMIATYYIIKSMIVNNNVVQYMATPVLYILFAKWLSNGMCVLF